MPLSTGWSLMDMVLITTTTKMLSIQGWAYAEHICACHVTPCVVHQSNSMQAWKSGRHAPPFGETALLRLHHTAQHWSGS